MLVASRSLRSSLPLRPFLSRALTSALESSSNNKQVAETEPFEDEERAQRGSPESSFGRKYIGQVALPLDLRTGIQEILNYSDFYLIRSDAMRIYESFRSLNRTPKEMELSRKKFEKNVTKKGARVKAPIKPHTINYGAREAVAYLAAMFPSTYATLYNVLAELRDRVPEFSPASVMDFGTGPGTAIWAARDVWGPRKGVRYVGVDISEHMVTLAENLVSHAHEENRFDDINFYRFFSYDPRQPKTDLVIAAYVLSDITSEAVRTNMLESLWNQTADTLVLMERGTRMGFQIIADARQHLLDLSKHDDGTTHPNHIIGPCPHSRTCPMFNSVKPAWCHFSQKLERPDFQRKTKNITNNLEDVKYSYLILRRGPVIQHEPPTIQSLAHTWSRLILPPLKRHGHVVMDACSQSGDLKRMVVPRSQGPIYYRDARKAMWGDLFPHEPKTPAVIWKTLDRNKAEKKRSKKKKMETEEKVATKLGVAGSEGSE